MAQDNKKDLTPDELLKKLLTSFGSEEQQSSDTDQLTIEDAPKKKSEGARPKIFRLRKDGGDDAAPTFDAPASGKEESDSERKELEERIRKAELFVAEMKDKKNEEDGPEEDSSKKKPSPFAPATEAQKKASKKDKPSEQPAVTEKESVKEQEEEPFAAPVEEPSMANEEIFDEKKKEDDEEKAEPSLKGDADKKAEPAEQKEEEDPFGEFALESEEFDLSDGEEAFEGPSDKEQGEPLPATEDGQQEDAAAAEEIDEAELDMMMLFGEKQKLEEMVGKEEARRRRLSMEGDAGAESIKEEYESADQNARFFKLLRGAYTKINIRMVLASVALIAVFFLELVMPELVASGKSLESLCGSFLAEIFENPVLTALCGLQVTALLVGVAYKEVYDGFKAFATGRSVPQMFLSLTVLFTVLYETALIFCHNAKAPFYNFPVALMAFLAVLFTKMNLSRTILTFKIVSSKRGKFVITHRGEDNSDLEKEAFGQYMSEKAGVFGVCKTDFVKNFAKRSAREPRYKGVVVILASVAAVVGVVFFVLGYYFSKENAFLSGLVMAIQSVLFCMPASAFILYALPFYKASKKAFHLDSAIVGEFSLEEYADATVISFDDKEVFPARNVKVHSLKLFGDTRIDHVLFGASSVFHRIGGPLEDVFDVATKESGYTDKVDVLEAAPGGIEAAVDGELVRIGNAGFMRSKGLLAAVDPDDTALEMEGRIMVMYLSIGEKLAAKMYITYSADKEIEDIMSSLYRAGMCIGIRTLDPNIDDRMISSHVDLSKYPVKVLRTDREGENFHKERTESGVVSKRNVRSLLKTLTFCRRILQVVRMGTVIKILGMVAGVGVSALVLYMSLTGKIAGVYEVNSLWVALYQLCWLLPATLISLIFV